MAFNEEIESALAAQNFDRVVNLDLARRDMLHEFTATNAPDDDRHFLKHWRLAPLTTPEHNADDA